MSEDSSSKVFPEDEEITGLLVSTQTIHHKPSQLTSFEVFGSSDEGVWNTSGHSFTAAACNNKSLTCLEYVVKAYSPKFRCL